MSCICFAVFTDPVKKKLWEGVFPEDHIPIKPENAIKWESQGKELEGWMVDFERVDAKQRQEMAERIAKAFSATPKDVLSQITKDGMPLLSNAVQTHFCPNHLKYGDGTYSLRAFI